MAFRFSDKIITNGLVFCMDAANPRSYTNGSNIAYDLCQTLSSGSVAITSYTPSNGGSWYFSGASNLGITGSDVSNILRTYGGPVTIEALIKTTSTTPQWVFTYGGTNSGFMTYGLRIDNTRLGSSTANSFQYITNTNGTDMMGIVIPNTWMSLTIVINTYYSTIGYKNGIYLGTSTAIPGFTASGLAKTYQIGNNYNDGSQFKGDIGLVRVYNRILSATEVLQNFNATRKRYNL